MLWLRCFEVGSYPAAAYLKNERKQEFNTGNNNNGKSLHSVQLDILLTNSRATAIKFCRTSRPTLEATYFAGAWPYPAAGLGEAGSGGAWRGEAG